MKRCNYIVWYVGECKAECIEDKCDKHVKLVCTVCRKPAYGEKGNTLGGSYQVIPRCKKHMENE